MGFRLPLAVALVLLATTAALRVDLAGACSCAGLDPRDRLADGDPAVIGQVVARRSLERSPNDSVYEYTVRVKAAFNAAIGPEVLITSGSDSGGCGFTWEVGEQVGAFLAGGEGQWTTNLCSLVDPAELRRALHPYPRARGHGRVALLAGGSFANARLIALDRGGRLLGYGFGAGDVTNISVCPGSRRSAELVQVGADTTRVAVRDLRTLRVVRTRRAPGDAVELRCADRSGTSLFAAGIDYPSVHPPGRVRVVRLTRHGPSVIASVSGDTVALARDAAYVADQAQVFVIDLSSGDSRRVTRFPDAGYVAPSPDGTRLAVSAARHGVRVYELPTGRPLGRARAGGIAWLSADRLLVRGVGRPRLYDADLRPLRRLSGFRALGQALVGDLLFGVDQRRLVALDLRGGRRTLVALLPDPDTRALEAVPGAPRVRTLRLAPGGTPPATAGRRCGDQPS